MIQPSLTGTEVIGADFPIVWSCVNFPVTIGVRLVVLRTEVETIGRYRGAVPSPKVRILSLLSALQLLGRNIR
jgi:hypothetical protein